MIKRKIKHFFRPVLRYKKISFLIFLIIAVICFQIFYPSSLSRPFIYVGGSSFGIKTNNEISEELQKVFSDSRFIFESKGSREEKTLHDIGGQFRNEYIEEFVFKYPLAERLIPFSVLFRKNLEDIPLDFSEEILGSFIDSVSAKYDRKPAPASIDIDKSGVIHANDPVSKISVDKKLLKERVKFQSKKIGVKNIIEIPLVEEKVFNKDKNIERLVLNIERLKNRDIILRSPRESHVQKNYTIKSDDLIKLISIDKEIKIDNEKLPSFIGDISKELKIEAKPTIIDIVDGREKERKEGVEGREISLEVLKNDLESYINNGGVYPEFYLEYKKILPNEQKKYSYTNTQDGLQAKVSEIGRRYNVRVSLKQLDGAGWEASYRENESTPSASTYKLFVALKLFDEINKGSVSWESGVLDTNTKGCFYRMIVNSTNLCAEEWIRQFGRVNLNNYLGSIGFSDKTTFTAYDAARTNASDLMKAVIGIYDGSLAKGQNRDILLNYMNIQKWRYGIPTGSSGKVYDKVGFLWDYIHDAAIVEHPRGKYALVVMTKGASYGVIALITRELEAFMYP